MNEVSSQTYQVLFDALRRRGISPVQLSETLPTAGGLDWDSFAALCEHFETLYHEDTTTIQNLETWFEHRHYFNGFMTSPHRLYRRIEQQIGPSLAPNLIFRRGTKNGSYLELKVEVPEPYQPSPAFFRLFGEALRRAPRIINQGDAIVEMRISPRQARYLITLPPSLTIAGRLKMAYYALFKPEIIRHETQYRTEQFEAAQQELKAARTHLEYQHHHLQLIDTLRWQLFREIDLNTLGQLIISFLLKNLHYEGASLWVETSVELRLLHESGVLTSKPSKSYVLQVGSTSVGRLDVWMRDESTRMLLESLLPFVSFALHNNLLVVKQNEHKNQLAYEYAERERLTEEMRLAEERWIALVEDAPAALTILDRNGIIQYINRTYSGIPIDKVLGTSIFDYSPLEFHETIIKAMKRAERTGDPETYEHVSTNEEGELSWYESRLSPVIRHNKLVNFTLISTDITQRRQNQIELQKRALEMKTLADVSAEIIQTLDPDELMIRVCELTRKRFDLYHVQIYLLDESGKTLTVAAGTGTPGQNLVKAKWSFVFNGPKQGLVVRAARTRCAVVVNDVSKERDFFYNMYLPRTRAEMALPLVVGERLIGVLDIQADKAYRFTEAEVGVMETLAAQVAVALNNAQLFVKLRRQNELADTLRDISLVLNSTLDLPTVLQRILDQVKRVLPYDAANIRLDDGTGRFYPVAWVGYERFGNPDIDHAPIMTTDESRLLRMMVNEKRSSIVSDLTQDTQWADTPIGYEWMQSWAGTPIVVEDRLMGMVSLDHSQAGFYTSQHMPLLESLRTQVSIAVTNARLFEAERRRRQEIESVQRSSLILTSVLELTQVLDAIVNAVVDLTKADDVHVFLYDGENLTFGAGLHLGEQLEQAFIEPRPSGVTYHVARTGEPFIVNNIHQHPLYHGSHFEFMSAIMGLPLKIGERVVGVMNIVYANPHNFEDATIQALQLLVNQASIAIENARLYETISDYAEQLADRVRERTHELERERAQLQAILDSMGEGVIYDENLDIKYFNQALLEITGYEKPQWYTYQEMLGELIPDEKIRSDMMDSLYNSIARHQPWKSEATMYHHDGTPFYAKITCHPVLDASGTINGAVMLIQDISADKELEAQKDRFIAHASHELRTPLANLKTRIYLMKRQPEKYDYHMGIMEKVSEQMTELVEDLLDLARFQRGALQLEQDWAVIQEMLQFVHDVQVEEAHKKQITLTKAVPDAPLRAWVDLRRLRQVVTNLVVNAINYTRPEGNIELRLVVDGDSLEIQVQDNGVGIAREYHEQVFQPFFRATQGTERGTGLGLTISYQIVKLHGGDILLESELGKGSLFRVRLPIHPPTD